MQTALIYQDRSTGKRVRIVGSLGDSEGFVMVKGQDNVPYHVMQANLIPCSSEGVPDHSAVFVKPEEPEEKIPDPVINLAETRLNINVATAEEIAARVPGIGYKTAKALIDYRLTLPGEKYRNLDQLKQAVGDRGGRRPNWESIHELNLLYVG